MAEQKNLAVEAIQMIRDAIVEKGIEASGRTGNSLKGEDTGTRVIVYADGTGAPVSTLQYGRPGGKVPLDFVGIIKQWIIDKGLPVTPLPFSSDNPRPKMRKHTEHERGLNKMAGSIAYAIKEKGTVRHRENRDDIYTPAQEYVISEFTKRWTDNIVNEFLK